MVKRGIKPVAVTYNSLVDSHCLRGEMDKARKVFDKMIAKSCETNLRSHNNLINGYCKNKRIDEAFALFEQMISKGLIANVVTYNSLIDGLCKVGRTVTTLL